MKWKSSHSALIKQIATWQCYEQNNFFQIVILWQLLIVPLSFLSIYISKSFSLPVNY